MAKQWTYKYGENTIVVKNEKVVGLYVNDKLIDSVKGTVFRANLKGKLDTGEDIQATVGGDFFTVDCKLAINSFYMAPIEVK